MSFADEMAAYDEQMAEAAARPRGGGNMLPDGKHQVQITEFVLERTDEGWTVTAKFQNEVGSVRKWYNLHREVDRNIFAGDIAMMGYEGPASKADQWIEAEGPIGVIAEINVKTKPGNDRDFTNVYVNRVLGKTALQEFDSVPAAGVPVGADDDIPF